VFDEEAMLQIYFIGPVAVVAIVDYDGVWHNILSLDSQYCMVSEDCCWPISGTVSGDIYIYIYIYIKLRSKARAEVYK